MHQNEQWIIPVPLHADWTAENFRFGADVFCLTGALPDGHTETLFQELWHNFCGTGSSLHFRTGEKLSAFQFCVSRDGRTLPPPILPAEEDYALSAGTDGVSVTGGSREGMIRGFFTLLQMIRPLCLQRGAEQLLIPGAKISDHPAIPFRFLHLCIFPETTLPHLFKMVRMAGLLKYSHIILEFWGMLRLNTLPELSWREAYTKEQIRPLLDDIRSMGMEPIPMVNCLGHASASRAVCGRHVVLDQNPRLAPLFEPDGWTWCLSNPETRTLLRNVRAELMDFFGPGKYFHIGCDEAYSFASCPLCAAHDRRELLVNYLNELTEELGQYKRRPIMWGDMLLDAEQWKYPLMASSRPDQRTHEIIDRLDRRMIIADWQYDIQEGDVPTIPYFMEKGFDVLPCPWQDYGNIFTLGENAVKYHTFGFLPTTWHTLPEHMTLLPLAAETGWRGTHIHDLHMGIYSLTASLERKVFPANSDYKTAGFCRHEVSE